MQPTHGLGHGGNTPQVNPCVFLEEVVGGIVSSKWFVENPYHFGDGDEEVIWCVGRW